MARVARRVAAPQHAAPQRAAVAPRPSEASGAAVRAANPPAAAALVPNPHVTVGQARRCLAACRLAVGVLARKRLEAPVRGRHRQVVVVPVSRQVVVVPVSRQVVVVPVSRQAAVVPDRGPTAAASDSRHAPAARAEGRHVEGGVVRSLRAVAGTVRNQETVAAMDREAVDREAAHSAPRRRPS